MSVLDLVTGISQGVLLLSAVLTFIDYLRHRDVYRFDIALMFACLASSTLAKLLSSIFGFQAPWLAVLTGMAVMAQPYLLLRLVGHFRAVPVPIRAFAIGGLGISWVLLALMSRPTLPEPLTLFIVLYFALVEGYATLAFMRGAISTGGVTRWRLTLAALGSGELAAVLLLAGVQMSAPDTASMLAPIISFVAMLAIVSYYFGFSPPFWLKQAWQLNVVYHYMTALSGRSTHDRAQAAIDELCRTAWKLTAARTSLAAIWEAGKERLAVRTFNGETLPVAELWLRDGAAVTAWREARPVFAATLSEMGPQLADLASRIDARAALIVPMKTAEKSWGLLVVLLRSGLFFPADDIDTLVILAERAAIYWENAVLVEQLEKSNHELIDANQAKSRFLASMSHELRTPLSAIIGFSELLLNEDQWKVEPEVRQQYLTHINGSGQHLLNLINDILDLSKVEAGRMELTLVPVEIERAIEQVIATVAPVAEKKGVLLSTEAVNVGTVPADLGKFKQILYNLVSNSIKFTPPGGRVRVEAHRGLSELVVNVVDTGIGIAPEDQARVFEEFWQVASTTGDTAPGTGLGLPLSKRFVELHGGRIFLESAAGQGSRVTFTLPLEAAAPAGAPVLEPAARNGGAPVAVVLVAEDDPRAANLMSIYLTQAGYGVEVAEDGEIALAKARALHPLAITLDVLLPKLDGWEVLRALKLDKETRDIPVLVVSAMEQQELGLTLGAADYFVKPIDRESLLNRLSEYTPKAEANDRGLSVLIVDDEAQSRELIAAELEPAGVTVLQAGGGEEGIALAHKEHPDVILLDLMMPGTNGFEVVERLHSDPATKGIPVIVVTAKDLTAEDKALLNSHVLTVVQKGRDQRAELLHWLDSIRQSRLKTTAGGSDGR